MGKEYWAVSSLSLENDTGRVARRCQTAGTLFSQCQVELSGAGGLALVLSHLREKGEGEGRPLDCYVTAVHLACNARQLHIHMHTKKEEKKMEDIKKRKKKKEGEASSLPKRCRVILVHISYHDPTSLSLTLILIPPSLLPSVSLSVLLPSPL